MAILSSTDKIEERRIADGVVLKNKVTLITGAARGQGRAHSIGMSEAGAAIIAVDICDALVEFPNGPTSL